MTENKLISLDTGEKCWLMIGICLGVIFTIVFLYVYTYLPKITEVQRVGLTCIIIGGILGFVISKFEWGEIE